MTDYNFSSSEFIDQLKSGDEKAIAALVKKYNKTLFNAALGQGVSVEFAEEVLHRTWAAFFENIQKFEGRSHIRTYLFGILYNKCKEFWREKKKYIDNEEYDPVVDSSYQDGGWTYFPVETDKFVEATQTFEKIEECMEGLSPNQKMAFHLKEVQEEDTSEICNILGVSDTNLRVLIYRAKNRLRKCLEGYFPVEES
ncbi:MAG: RNA polymerase sigma factor [Bacteriovoracaceae bacterium]|nr:RNA polymerase sigma factor [Bacteriovoracaceae bacterium]